MVWHFSLSSARRDRSERAIWPRRFSFRSMNLTRLTITRSNVGLHPSAGLFLWPHCVYGAAVTHRLRAMGIRDKPIAPGSPWQNGFAERLIGSIRRECVGHVVVLGEAYLRRILTKYAAYYNQLRTHRSLNKDAPIHRAIQHAGRIISAPVLGGLHHHYCRI